MTHPCSDHPCDRCYRCDVLGECCLEPAPAQVVQPPVTVTRPDPLHDAVIQDAKTAVSLGELVRLDFGHPGFAVLLLPGSVAEPIPNDSRKEPIHVLAPRTVQ